MKQYTTRKGILPYGSDNSGFSIDSKAVNTLYIFYEAA